MHVSFDESISSKKDIVVCDDDDILEVPIEEIAIDDKVRQSERKAEIIHQEQNQCDFLKIGKLIVINQ